MAVGRKLVMGNAFKKEAMNWGTKKQNTTQETCFYLTGLLITPSKTESSPEVLVLYRSKQQTLATAQIVPEKLRFDIQTDTFSSFIDSRGLAWSVNFSSKELSQQFSMNLALAKFRSSKETLSQNLRPGIKDTPDVVEKYDSAEFRVFYFNKTVT